jgi:predicted aspartyl protease
MAMTPRLESGRFPYPPLRIELRGHTYPVEALIDSGFDGYVAVPPELLAGVEAPDDYHPWILADGSQVVAPFYLGIVHVGDVRSLPAAITALGDEPIVGRGIIDHFLLCLDHGQRVIVEP